MCANVCVHICVCVCVCVRVDSPQRELASELLDMVKVATVVKELPSESFIYSHTTLMKLQMLLCLSCHALMTLMAIVLPAFLKTHKNV